MASPNFEGEEVEGSAVNGQPGQVDGEHQMDLQGELEAIRSVVTQHRNIFPIINLLPTQGDRYGMRVETIEFTDGGDESFQVRYIAMPNTIRYLTAESGVVDPWSLYNPQEIDEDEAQSFWEEDTLNASQEEISSVDRWRESAVVRTLRNLFNVPLHIIFNIYCSSVRCNVLTDGVIFYSHMWRRYSRLYGTMDIAHFREAHNHLLGLRVTQVQYPRYPVESLRLVPPTMERYLFQTSTMRTMVYRHSMRTTLFNGYVYIRPIHVWSGQRIQCTCHSMTCLLCIESQDRAINAFNGHYDQISSQHTGVYDYIPSDVADVREFIQAFNTIHDESYEPVPPLIRMEDDSDDDEDFVQAVHINMNHQQPVAPDTRPARGVHDSTFTLQDDVTCSICLEKLESALTIACGHSYHRTCIMEWGRTCPNCRVRVDYLKAEAYEPIFVEYTSANVLGEMEFDDPVDYRKVQARPGKYQCYIINTNLSGETFCIKGNVLEVRDISGPEEVILASKINSYTMTGKQELQFVATEPLEFRVLELPEQPPVLPQRVLFVIVGTYGDIQPMRLLKEECQRRGIDACLCAPGGDFSLPWESMDARFRSNGPTGYLNVQLGANITDVGELTKGIKHAILNFEPDLIVSSFFVPGVHYAAEMYGIPLIMYGSVPEGEGALSFQRQYSRWGQFWAKIAEKAIIKGMEMATIMHWMNDGYAHALTPYKTVLAVAPELHDDGIGNLLLSDPGTPKKRTYDVFHTFGSTISTRQQDIDWVEKYRFMPAIKVLFQTSFTDISKPPNVTFIGPNNHLETMQICKVVVCHGGSGTLQTALSCGCGVLIHPTWVDQHYWVAQSQRKGFLVSELTDTTEMELLIQLRLLLDNPLLGRSRLTHITPKQALTHVLSKYTPAKELECGVYMWGSRLVSTPAKQIAAIERLSGVSHLDHLGLAKCMETDQGKVLIMLDAEPVPGTNEKTWTMIRQVTTYCQLKLHTWVKVNVPFDEKIFHKYVEEAYHTSKVKWKDNLGQRNCRVPVALYLRHFGVDIEQVIRNSAGQTSGWPCASYEEPIKVYSSMSPDPDLEEKLVNVYRTVKFDGDSPLATMSVVKNTQDPSHLMKLAYLASEQNIRLTVYDVKEGKLYLMNSKGPRQFYYVFSSCDWERKEFFVDDKFKEDHSVLVPRVRAAI